MSFYNRPGPLPEIQKRSWSSLGFFIPPPFAIANHLISAWASRCEGGETAHTRLYAVVACVLGLKCCRVACPDTVCWGSSRLVEAQSLGHAVGRGTELSHHGSNKCGIQEWIR